jgi:excisionase family DNA binding protein
MQAIDYAAVRQNNHSRFRILPDHRITMENSMSKSLSNAFDHDDPLLRDVDTCALLNISKPTFWRWVRRGTFPKPIKLGALSRWPRSDVTKFLERAAQNRDNAA